MYSMQSSTNRGIYKRRRHTTERTGLSVVLGTVTRRPLSRSGGRWALHLRTADALEARQQSVAGVKGTTFAEGIHT